MPHPSVLPGKIEALPRSQIRRIMALAAEMDDVVHLEVGEPAEGTRAEIIRDAMEAALNGATKYVPNAGSPALRKLIAERISDRNRVAVDPGRVVATTGAVGALFTAMSLVVEPGEEVLLPDPGWTNYQSMVLFAGATFRTYPLYPERGFEPDPEEIEALIGPKTRAILVNSPGNPTGAVWRAPCIDRVAEIARARNLHVISDEIYEEMTFDADHVSFMGRDIDDRLWVVSGFSKSFAMTGWRIGWLVAPAHSVESAIALQEPTVSCISAVSQAAAIAALSKYPQTPGELAAIYRRRRDILVEELAGSGLIAARPAGAFYCLIDITRTGMSSMEAALDLLEKKKVAAVPGGSFGPRSDRYLRLAFTTSDDRLKTGCRRILEWVSER